MAQRNILTNRRLSQHEQSAQHSPRASAVDAPPQAQNDLFAARSFADVCGEVGAVSQEWKPPVWPENDELEDCLKNKVFGELYIRMQNSLAR